MRVVNFTHPFYLISDTHFYHTKLFFEFGLRKEFKTTEEVNELMFNNWNNTISKDTFILFLGDFVIGHPEKYKVAQTLYDSLNGKRIFIKGNHDEHLKKYTNIPVIDGPIEIIYKGNRILLNHEPIWDFDRNIYNYHIFGHVHNSEANSKVDHTCMKNVSVEMINYTPQKIDDILNRFEEIKKDNQNKYQQLKR